MSKLVDAVVHVKALERLVVEELGDTIDVNRFDIDCVDIGGFDLGRFDISQGLNVGRGLNVWWLDSLWLDGQFDVDRGLLFDETDGTRSSQVS